MNIHFDPSVAQIDSGALVACLAMALSAYYGRLFDPATVVRRNNGKFGVAGGLPGLHPINFFGAEICGRLGLKRINALTGVSVATSGGGCLVSFPEHKDEFSREELTDIESILGKEYFRGYSNNGSPVRINFFSWFLSAVRERRRTCHDYPVFDYGFDRMLAP